ncbi:MAG: SRPBCC family protein, partial [Actinomycetota bacterium]
MAAVTVVVEIDRTPEQVWAYVRDLGSHVEWMADATEIRFLTDQREGTGTSFECDTKVGPIKLTDVMTITDWVDESTMGVRHEGVVTGVGEFTLTPIGETGTHFSWREDL